MTGVTDTNVNRGKKSHLKFNIFSLNGNWEETSKIERGQGKENNSAREQEGEEGN